jgi:protein required for attachment to host cells
MPDVSDMELLRDYDRQGSETAFAVKQQIRLGNMASENGQRHRPGTKSQKTCPNFVSVNIIG